MQCPQSNIHSVIVGIMYTTHEQSVTFIRLNCERSLRANKRTIHQSYNDVLDLLRMVGYISTHHEHIETESVVLPV